jgi:hypothetical protein
MGEQIQEEQKRTVRYFFKIYDSTYPHAFHEHAVDNNFDLDNMVRTLLETGYKVYHTETNIYDRYIEFVMYFKKEK